MRYLLILLLLVGCGKPVLDIDPSLKAYINEFILDGESVGISIEIEDLSVHFKDNLNDQGKDIMGVCIQAPNTTPTILISKEYWNQLNGSDRRELLYHELGHCILHRGHRDDVDAYGKPLSIMSTYFDGGELNEATKLKYLIELFTGKDT